MTILHIDRSKPFVPSILGEGWSIEWQDECSLKLTEVDLSKVSFEDLYEHQFKKDSRIFLDIKVFHLIQENCSLIPKNWEESSLGGQNGYFIYFQGTQLKSPQGMLVLPYIIYGVRRGWEFGYGDVAAPLTALYPI